MGYLLKEALKTLCGVNQWSYAVFWKIGCQNPKLLIWEECYYESASCSGLPQFPGTGNDYSDSWNLQSNQVHLLVSKMMTDNHVNIVGEGLVGRVAFTGNHQWILSESCYRDTHPPEVLKDLCQQFSAGMKTVAVIPVYPHGAIQFGSFLTIMENLAFINDVTSLVLQLGYVPGVLLSETYAEKGLSPINVAPLCPLNSTPGGSSLESNIATSSCLFDTIDNQTSYSLTGGEIQNDLHSNVTAAAFQAPNSSPSHFRSQSFNFGSSNQSMNGVAKAEVIPSNPGMWMNQHGSQYIPRSNQDFAKEQKILTDTGFTYCANGGSIPAVNEAANESSISKNPTPSELRNVSLSCGTLSRRNHLDNKFAERELNACKIELEQNAVQAHGFVDDDSKQMTSAKYDSGTYVECPSGDDLFDVLGADFKNKLFSNCWNNWDKNSFSSKGSQMYSTSQANSDSGIFSCGTDHLLDAVVSKVSPPAKQSLDDNVSCGTTLTNLRNSSAPKTPLPYGRFGVSDQMIGELFGVPKYLAKAGAMSSCSKEDSGTYSHGSSIYGSQLSSWIEKGSKSKQSNSISTGHSKKPDEMGKTNRKRLKPGENPRPRPKDRQMIQDRVKELREIVPNGAKCSIDALLERTIKHMLFLQSVTKHADKLKQTGGSKIISKDGGLLLKDNFEGGATWAYEVGSQSMVCPIIVEDLNQPRQMLVEMLCEEKGLFLERADIIRGLGLTILKGVMESRNEKIWARFAVEANRDVTRMEIFISLVRLLEQTAKSGVAQPNGVSND